MTESVPWLASAHGWDAFEEDNDAWCLARRADVAGLTVIAAIGMFRKIIAKRYSFVIGADNNMQLLSRISGFGKADDKLVEVIADNAALSVYRMPKRIL